jgi:hypothetical protein
MSKRRDWTQQVPPIVGNSALIDRSERPNENIFERNRPDGDQMVTKAEPIGNQVVTKTQPNGGQVVKNKRRPRRKRATFTPNLVTEQILQQVRGKYGTFSAFINSSIEDYYNKSKQCSVVSD